MTQKPRPTIYDVARAANVAPSTVSRTFSRPGRVNTQTRMHVLRIASQLDYQPNFVARGLSTAHSQMLALMIPDLTRSLVTEVVQGAEMAAGPAGYSLLLSLVPGLYEPGSIDTERTLTIAEGILLIDCQITDSQAHLIAADKATVSVCRSIPDMPSVVSDSSLALRASVGHLKELGHRATGYVAGREPIAMDEKRWAAVQTACAELGMSSSRIRPSFWDGELAIDAELVSSPITSVICGSIDVAFTLIRRLRINGVQVPRDVSIISFDDAGLADLADPPLTAITAQGATMGAAAVAKLVTQLTVEAPPPAQTQEVPAQLIVRGSTAAPARG